ncbi:MAG: alpha/beta hydrolase [Actinobacteria bacterium RBG_19FT_COMBO_54_7]|uniref:Alpha/beta hydrolase n=1 Tax=Candidatus Solincola sediminis TaxID=1797199 RepID=A0A1F2WNX5_9ACTN|nr:MAG: alpha/beta hydrolase [Candidatus Solincola sediminis]OFW61828.1 MAG: alpha/beta hydrolase [Candidatus Solincola sediminis]OFW68662.1 MAG: alpha/beta hydrolase [Actinobacteria bacterium RBG_19FT_COMBO_54_7]
MDAGNNLRIYSDPPYRTAVIHGGPGAAGEMAPVARELSGETGVLEPLQTATSLEGLIQELLLVLEEKASTPATLIGWSWGAWLSYMLAARCPQVVERLILVGTPPFEEKYAEDIMKTRLSRLAEGERDRLLSLMHLLETPDSGDKNSILADFAGLVAKADSYDPLPRQEEITAFRYDIYRNVWEEAYMLRSSGELLRLGESIKCPIVAIHGDFDPHPYEGVVVSLSQVVARFRFVLLPKCGHYPWQERAARSRFYEALRQELGTGGS